MTDDDGRDAAAAVADASQDGKNVEDNRIRHLRTRAEVTSSERVRELDMTVKRLFLTASLLLGCSAVAEAADMPVKAPPLPPPAWSWAGLYVGLNGGYSFGRDPLTEVVNGLASQTASVVTPRGGVFGGQIGYNWLAGNALFGLEGDAQWTSQDDKSCSVNCTFDIGPSEFTADTVRQRLDWFVTVRGRVGWVSGATLFYVTGGAAVGGVRETDSHLNELLPPNNATFSKTPVGAAVGFGMESHLGGNWTAKVEYLHIAFEPINTSAMLPLQCNPPLCAGPFAIATSSALADNIIRVGLNYQIFAGRAVGPAPVDPVPAGWSWAGFYVGGNAGYGVGSDPLSQLVTAGGVPLISTLTNARVSPTGALLGGQAGYNWQAGAFVFGVEGDGQWSDINGQSCALGCGGFSAVSQRLDWLAMARGRVGWANAGYLFYVTGGGAFGGVKEIDAILPPMPTAAVLSQNRSGWTAGGGIEARLGGRWTGKVEYLHVDLGSISNAVVFGAGPTVQSTSSAFRDDLVRVGLNYNIGG